MQYLLMYYMMHAHKYDYLCSEPPVRSSHLQAKKVKTDRINLRRETADTCKKINSFMQKSFVALHKVYRFLNCK